MPTELVTVNLTRENEKEEWGFELTGGGRDKNVRLFIDLVKPGSIAEKVGLRVKDSLVKIGNDCALDYTIQEAMESLKRGKDFFDMIVEREAPDVVLQKSVVEDPRYEGLDKQDRTKVGFHDVSKPTLRKDWNCPWIRRDGKGIKKVLRPEEKQKAPIKTSYNHFYSEPGSILAPDAPPIAPEELEKMIQERMGLLTKEEEAAKGIKMEQSKPNEQQPKIQEERFEQNKMEVEFSHQQQQQQHHEQQQVQQHEEQQLQQHVEQQQCQDIHLEENGELDEEDSCPPDLESVEPVVPHKQQVEFSQQQQTTVQPEFNLSLEADSELLRNLAIAIQAGMEAYQGDGTYEPSADELIDVLKNLENLAAANPALYRAIVDQIKVCHTKFEDPKQKFLGNQPLHDQGYEEPQTNGHQECEPHMEQGYSEVDRQGEEMYHQEQLQQEQVHKMNGEPEMPETDHVQVQEEGPQLSSEELQQIEKEAKLQAEVDREHEEQMRQLREKKRKEKEPPPPPKTITVMAGSRNRPAWPIAPGIANANQPRQITLVSGEDEKEWEQNRMQVAEAAGLKHVDHTIGDQADIYGQGDFAWSGSLRPTSHKFAKSGKGKPQDVGVSPWAGSLRHVDQNKMRKKKQKKEHDDDDLYGNAPWMGTLRHVKHENKVFQSATPKFKKYPDEDAPNPFESMQGRNAKPVYPLTPAAVIPPGGSSSEAKKNRKQMEEVERITSGLRETRSLSGSLLKALMPKLLKEHESKYEPLGHDETFHIMEEILAMQIGLGDDTRVGDEENDEAEAMIRAITHGEIDNAVYSKMADDLEQAAQIKRKGDKPKKKKKKKTNTAGTSSASELATSASEVSVK